MQKDKIDINIDKEVLVKTSKKKENKKRKREDDLEDLMQMDNIQKSTRKLSDKMEKMDISDESEEILSASDPEEEVYIDEGHDDNSEDYAEEEEVTEKNKKVNVNIWDEKNKLEEGQELEFDNEAYEMLHRAKVEWPCMTLDFIIPEHFYPPVKQFYEKKCSTVNDNYPYSCYLVAGSQTTSANGFLYYMKWSNMQKTMYDDDPDKAADSDEEEGKDPFLKYEKVQVKGNINRIKSMKNSYLTAFWSDHPSIEICDMRALIEDSEANTEDQKELKNKKKRKLESKNVSLKSFQRSLEGFALEWACLTPGVLAAGGQDKKIEIYIPSDESFSNWTLNTENINNNFGIVKGHKSSIEDLIWSPVQAHVLASCSVDKSIRFWDLRLDKNSPPIVIEAAHQSDVNCISWNNFCDFMIASGGDDNSFKVWDIRYISNGPISNIQWHKGPITAIAWDPYEDSQLAVSSEDNRLSIWDFAVEPDDTQLFDATNQEIPQQLIFLHQGQENIKDLKFHPQYKNFLVSTAENGINVFRPAFDDEDSNFEEDEMYVDK
jgi:ribosome assembly protein RRB1